MKNILIAILIMVAFNVNAQTAYKAAHENCYYIIYQKSNGTAISQNVIAAGDSVSYNRSTQEIVCSNYTDRLLEFCYKFNIVLSDQLEAYLISKKGVPYKQ